MRTNFFVAGVQVGRMIVSASFICMLAISVLATTPLLTNDGRSANQQLRKIADYRLDLKAFMKDSKRDEDPRTQGIAVYNLCQLHAFIVADPRFESSQQLQGMRIVAANRLEEFSKEFKKQKLREVRRNKSKTKSKTTSTSNSSGPSNESARPLRESSQPSRESSIDEGDSDGSDVAALQSFQAMSALSGGPSQMFNYVDGRMGPPWDHGEELVDLIENTINPASWRSNGGNGTIHYFRPLRVLVVGASSQVQDDTLELLRMMRRADGVQLNLGFGN